MSNFLLDTNIPSEIIRSTPNRNVADWVFRQPESGLFLSVVTIGEVRRGLEMMPLGKRRKTLEDWLIADLIPHFDGRILPVTVAIANRWGVLSGQRAAQGKPLSMADGLIAATAIEHQLTVVTRNVADYEGLGLNILNPWSTAG